MINAAIFASGEGTNAENLMRHFANDPRIKIKMVVTNRDDAGVIARAEALRKTVHIINKEALNNYTERIIEFLQTENIELIILAGFLLKIPEALVKAFPNRILNIHPALLPAYGGKGMYGMNVHRAVIADGVAESGITVHFVDEEYDRGATVMQVKCTIEPGESPESLAEKVHELEYRYFPIAIEQLLG